MMKKVLVTILVAFVAYWCIPTSDPFDTASIKGKRVLITGASSGVGEQLAYHYAKLGASVVVTARREPLLKKVVEACKKINPQDAKFGYVVADMAKETDNKRVIKESTDLLGGLDHLILNHGSFENIDFWRGTDDDIHKLEETFQVNTISFVRLASYARRHLEKSDSGAIAVVSSALGKIPSFLFTGYSASKFALDGFFTSMRQEYELTKVNITITMCFFGTTGTDSAFRVGAEVKTRLNLDLNVMAKHVTLGVPDEVAWAVLRSTALGQPEMYYPGHYIRQAAALRLLFPWVLDLLVETTYEEMKTSEDS